MQTHTDYTPAPSVPPSDEFLKGYIDAALWTSDEHPGIGEWTDRGGTWSHENIDPDTLACMAADCAQFVSKARKWLSSAGDAHRNGVEFWLTRNGHGAGFWDRGYGRTGDRLTTVAQTFGEFTLYVGDDGTIYGM